MIETEFITLSMEVLKQDKFQNLPPMAQLSYFYICSSCDKNGITINPKAISRGYLGTDEYVIYLFRAGLIIEIGDDDDLKTYKIVDWEKHYSTCRVSRVCPSYSKWRKDVLQDGNHECKICGETENLITHHIKPYKEFPELKHDVSNGVVLCVTCHKRAHKGGKK